MKSDNPTPLFSIGGGNIISVTKSSKSALGRSKRKNEQINGKNITKEHDMNNIAPHPNIWEGMSLDQTNAIKEEWEKEIPVVELMKIRADPDSLIGRERDVRLRQLGYSAEQIEEMTGYKRSTEPLLSTSQSSEENRVRFYGPEIWERMKAYDIKDREEFEVEYNLRLKNGIDIGFIEELHTDPML